MTATQPKNETRFVVVSIASLLLGVVIGQLMYDPTWSSSASLSQHKFSGLLELFDLIGNSIFIGALKLLVLPLILVSVITAIADLEKGGALGNKLLYVFCYYLGTMVLAVTLGLILVQTIAPGSYVDPQLRVANDSVVDAAPLTGDHSLRSVVVHFVESVIPNNIFAALSTGQVLSVLSFALFFGIVLGSSQKAATVLRPILQAVFEVLLKMTQCVLFISPIGIFALTAGIIARVGIFALGGSLSLYMITVLAGLGIHALVVLPLIALFIRRQNPWILFKATQQALVTAFATSSSSATMPVTLKCLEERAKVNPKITSLVVPLGSTINMDGTALYEAVAVVFLAQVFGVEMTMTTLIAVAFTASFAAIGAASIPSAGLVTMALVIEAVNQTSIAATPIPLTAIGIILGVDRLLDMFRTMVNVWGDIVGAWVLDKLIK